MEGNVRKLFEQQPELAQKMLVDYEHLVSGDIDVSIEPNKLMVGSGFPSILKVAKEAVQESQRSEEEKRIEDEKCRWTKLDKTIQDEKCRLAKLDKNITDLESRLGIQNKFICDIDGISSGADLREIARIMSARTERMERVTTERNRQLTESSSTLTSESYVVANPIYDKD